MFKNLKLGTRIALGFSVLIVLAGGLGAVAVWSMWDVETHAQSLTEEAVPMVSAANNVERHSLLTMYAMRAYGLTGEEQHLTSGREELTKVKDSLQACTDLAETHSIDKLNENADACSKAVNDYQALVDETVKATAAIDQDRATLESSASAYMENCAEFLSGQNAKFKTDLAEQQEKIRLVSSIVDLGTAAQVLNFKSQATADLMLMEQAISTLKKVKEETQKLRPITTLEADIKRIDDTEKAASAYGKAMEEFLTIRRAQEALRQKMDQSAKAYIDNCDELLKGQEAKLKQDLKAKDANVDERLQKISLVTAMIEKGDAARVSNFKAQATNDAKPLQEAVDTLKGIEEVTAALHKITREQDNIKRVDVTNKAAADYRTAIEEFAASETALAKLRQSMDENAGAFVKDCDEFLAAQQAALDKDMSERHDKITTVNDIIDVGNETRISTFKSQALRDPELIRKATANFAVMDEKFEALRKITRQKEDLDRIDSTKAAAQGYQTAMTSLLENWTKLQELSKSRDETSATVLQLAQTTAQDGIDSTRTVSETAYSSLNLASNIVGGGLIGVLVLGMLLSVGITRSITGPLKRVIDGLTNAADQVDSAANQISQSSQQLAAGASQQASSLEETSAAMEQMSSQTKANADGAQQTAGAVVEITEAARHNAENTKRASELAGEAKAAAGNGAKGMDEIARAMAEIREGSDRVSDIIQVIEDITHQTKMLATNAAIEAARAGDQGKGFAVVADEVSKLAESSKTSAKQISDLIRDSARKAHTGTELVDNGSAVLKEILEKTGRVAELINDVTSASDQQAQNVGRVDQLVKGISSSSEEQANGVDQVSRAVSDMDKVTQQNAANAEEAASASEELAAQAATLKSLVDEVAAMVGRRDGIQARAWQDPETAASNGHCAKATRSGHPLAPDVANGAGNGSPAKKPAGGTNRIDRLAKAIPMPNDFQDF